MSLNVFQQSTADAARAALDDQSPSMYELADMAGRVGRLEWHLAEMLALVAELAADTP